MATCFDRKTVIIRPIKNIYRVQQSEDSSPQFIGLMMTVLRSKHVAII